MDDVRLPSSSFSLNDLVSDINADIETEINTRTRLAETLEARIAWAIVLKECAEGKASGTASQATFKSVACETLLANEENSRFLFASSPTPPPLPQTNQQNSRLPKKTIPSSGKQKASFLYIRSTALNHSTNDLNHLYLLKCPACGRTTFTSLQGLLNHARLSHNLEWGTHDECIRACAVPDNDMDISQGAEVGIGPSGVLAGLRTIFERAVGTSKNIINYGAEPTESQPDNPQEPVTTQTQLNLTLGLHEESPALAPFLGKVAIRRQISVCDEDVDITSTQPETSSKRRWKMPFANRGFREELSNSSNEPPNHNHDITPPDSNSQEGTDSVANEGTLVNQHSRFYFIARIVVADRSMWVTPERRTSDAPSHTHKWMISIDAPSYAFHITSILKSVHVTPQTEDIASVSCPPPTRQPPFIVIGTSNTPFLAKIELTFTGTGRDGPRMTEQKVTLQHWVDLDPFRSEMVTLGQEQMLDIELDKNTQLNPVQTGYPPINSKIHWSLPPPNTSRSPKIKQVNGHEQILLKLAKQYPLFAKEKPPPGVNHSYSYLLPTSSLQWIDFCIGRRKAIAWARSQAICRAYEDIRQSSEDNMQNLIRLKTGDVCRWLSRNGMFPDIPGQQTPLDVPSVKQEQDMEPTLPLTSANDQWCTICGQSMEASTQLDPRHDCATITVPRVSKLFRMDVRKSILEQKSQYHLSHHGGNDIPGYLPPAIHPSLLLWVKEVAESTRRPAFSTSHSETPFCLDELGGSLRDVEKTLAPYNALSIAVQTLVKKMVESGIRVIEEERNGATPTSKNPKLDKASVGVVSRKRLLTPSHILSGLSAYGRGGDNDSAGLAIKLSLAKLGAPARISHPSGGRQTEVEIKMEE